jgi:hypothetical protein
MKKKTSQNVEYYTPPELAPAILGVLGRVDLDAACSFLAARVNGLNAANIFTKEMNGLAHQWFGNVYLNPPYGKSGSRSRTAIWLSKLILEYTAQRVSNAIFLMNVATGSNWFAEIGGWNYPICFCYKRIVFIGSDGKRQTQPQYDNMFLYLGSDFAKFKHYFQNTPYPEFPHGIGRVFGTDYLPLLAKRERQQLSIDGITL